MLLHILVPLLPLTKVVPIGHLAKEYTTYIKPVLLAGSPERTPPSQELLQQRRELEEVNKQIADVVQEIIEIEKDIKKSPVCGMQGNMVYGGHGRLSRCMVSAAEIELVTEARREMLAQKQAHLEAWKQVIRCPPSP